MPMRIRTALSRAAVCLLVASPVLAQKTDVIVLFNGDRVTCEIRSYDAGRLQVKTDIALATVLGRAGGVGLLVWGGWLALRVVGA